MRENADGPCQRGGAAQIVDLRMGKMSLLPRFRHLCEFSGCVFCSKELHDLISVMVGAGGCHVTFVRFARFELESLARIRSSRVEAAKGIRVLGFRVLGLGHLTEVLTEVYT